MARSLFPPTNAFLTRLSLPVGKPPSLLGCDLARGGMTGANGNGNPEKFFFSRERDILAVRQFRRHRKS
jgi:hypothetical protein